MGLSNLSTRNKLILAFALVMAGFIGLLWMAQGSLQSLRANHLVISQLQEDLAGFKEIRFNVHDVRAEVLNALLVRDPGHIREMTERFHVVNEHDALVLQNLQRHTAHDPALSELVVETTRLWREFARVRDRQIVPMLATGKFEEARVLTTGEQRSRVLQLRELGVRLDQQVGVRLRELELANRRLSERQLDRMFWFGGGLIVLALLLTALLARNIAQPLTQLTEHAQRISQETSPPLPFGNRDDEVGLLGQAFGQMGEYLQDLSRQAERLAGGDLRLAIKPRSDHDQLGRAFVRMIENLSQLTEEMQESIVVIASASEEILTTAGQVAGGAGESATAINEIATTIEQVKQTARQAYRRAADINDATSRNREIAQTGRDAVADTLGSMSQVRDQMHAMAESILRLGEQSQAISEIVATVNELAEQSNLLGVNASIEAGKAGDAGKGFAVVALEVKALAEQSKLATAQVRSILGDVQRAMTRAAMAAEQGGKAVDHGFERSRSSDEAMRLLAESLEESGDMAQQIATTSQQQLAGMDQVASAIGNLRQTSQDNAAGARQVDQSARDLHGLGSRLRRLATQFQLPGRQGA